MERKLWGGHQCGFRRNRSTADRIFCIRQILEKKWGYNEAVHQIFIEFKPACNSVRREVLYNNFIEFSIPMKMVRLIEMCLKDTYEYSRDQSDNNLSDRFHINPLNPELNPICYLLALLGAHYFLHLSRIRVKLLTLRRLMIYIYIYMEHPFLMFLDHTQRRSTVGRTPLDE